MRSALSRPPTLGFVVGCVVAFVGLLIGLGPLNDNSFLTHLATGRLIVASHHIPTHDPYSFTAPGHPWVVQSWLASLIWGVAEKWWGAPGVLLTVGVTAAVLAALVWTLTRPSQSLFGRLLIVMVLVVVGTDGGWVERPLIFGLVAFALTLLALEGRLDPRWLVPVFWFWVNVHGSFPLGLVAIVTFLLGARLDQGRWPSTELAVLKWAVIGTLVGGINPLGPRLLVFPLELLRRQDVLSNVIEWQAPKFTHIGQRAFLLELLAAMVLIVRRPTWRASLPLGVFTIAALLGARNVVFASLVLVPGLAPALTDLGTIRGDDRRAVFRPAVAAIAIMALLAALVAANGPVYSFNGYPVAAVTFLQRQGMLGPESRVISRDFVGNYLEGRFGPSVKVFFDDRYDMYPTEVVDDFATLNKGGSGWETALTKYHPSAVLWPSTEPLGQLLATSPHWQVIYTDQEFLVAVPR